MPNDPVVSSLGPDDFARLEHQRSFVHGFVAEESLGALGTVPGKLELIRALLDEEKFTPEQTWELQSLGIVFGDAVVQQVEGASWVIVDDEYGRDPAIRVTGSSVLVYPLTMISKRVEEGRPVDIFDLFDRVVADAGRIGRESA